MSRRDYSGPDLDGTVQYLGEAPHWQGEGETVDVVDDEPIGEERTENVPEPEPERDSDQERPDVEGQTAITDWGGGAA